MCVLQCACVFVARPGALQGTELQQWFGAAQGGSELPHPSSPGSSINGIKVDVCVTATVINN